MKFPPNHYYFPEEVETQGRGRRPAMLNRQLGTVMNKSGVSIQDTRMFFASLDIRPPSEHMLQEYANITSQEWQELNEEAMADNRRVFKSITGKTQGIVQEDTCFNNPPKGIGRYQPGTQSHTPMLCAITGLILAAVSHNKLCSKNHVGPCGPTCSINWYKHLAMGGTERAAAVLNARTLKQDGINLRGMVMDGTAKALVGKNF